MVQQNPLLFVKIKKCNFLLQTLAKRFSALHFDNYPHLPFVRGQNITQIRCKEAYLVY